MTKRFSAVLASALAVSLMFTACSSSVPAAGGSKGLYEHGLELVAMAEEMADSESYLEIYTGSPRISEVVSQFGQGDYSAPQKVYRLTPTADYLAGYDMAADLSGLSDTLKKTISDKAIASLATRINAMDGAENLAATTVCTAGKTFVSGELTEACVWLYVYENGFPVAVTFTAGEDSTVAASAMFISCSDFQPESSQKIEEYLGGGVKAEEIEK
ncbi:MAG: hypothetical protein IJO54_03895 [Oscillospiraceae bacterium]|nr:hypothetical protein [Oscillospiraceae bacterium]